MLTLSSRLYRHNNIQHTEPGRNIENVTCALFCSLRCWPESASAAIALLAPRHPKARQPASARRQASETYDEAQ